MASAESPMTPVCDLDPAGIAVRAAGLGLGLGGSVVLAFISPGTAALSLYIGALCLFHLLEFWTTARFNRKQTKLDSFLLSSNGVAYWAAQALGVVEHLAERRLGLHARHTNAGACAFAVGVALVLAGQAVRTAAMVQAAQSFSHALAYAKQQEHVLVTHGIYSFSRHPSYLGFFVFGVGTQVMLGNPIAAIVFAFILWKFFTERIRYVHL